MIRAPEAADSLFAGHGIFFLVTKGRGCRKTGWPQYRKM
jgi:hypothetical protein